MYKSLLGLLLAVAIGVPAQADVFGIFSSNGGPQQVVDGHVYAPTQSNVVDGSMHGYPFYSGCCEAKSSCCDRLWAGFCHARGCGMACCGSKGCGSKGCGSKGCGPKVTRRHHFGGMKGGCGCGSPMGYGHSSCGKGGCGYGSCGKSSFGYMSYRGLGGKGGCGFTGGCGSKGGCGLGGSCGGKGYSVCDPCGPKQPRRLGLFDWLHFGHGHGCDVCGDVGCSSCSGGKGGFGKGGYIEHAPIQSHDSNYYGTPTEADEKSTLQPPEVIVEPTSISDRSAWRHQLPVNPFAQPFSY